jgi:hypothetical protein
MEIEKNLDYLNNICDILMKKHDFHVLPPSTPTLDNQLHPNFESSEPIVIKQLDIDNLVHYVQIWTDIVSPEEVQKQFKSSNFVDLQQFEADNYLYDIGFFYVKINPNLSILEFFGLLNKIPWEQLRLPGSNQISYTSISQLFKDETHRISLQLMVLGDVYKFWILINPYRQMKHTTEATKLLLSGMGNLMIQVAPNFLKNCQELIESVEF